jgi:hypothetical protein
MVTVVAYSKELVVVTMEYKQSKPTVEQGSPENFEPQ